MVHLAAQASVGESLRDPDRDWAVNAEGTAAVAKIIPTVASGGVRGTEDVATLSRTPGVTGVVVGTALYESRVTLEELIASVLASDSAEQKS